MDADQYRASLEELGLSQVGAAPILNVSRNTAQNYAKDGPSGPAGRLMEVLISLPLDQRAQWFRWWREEEAERAKSSGEGA